jgi:hypothetical protein
LAVLTRNNSVYQVEIRISGKIDPGWSEWFGELQMQEQASCEETLFTGELPDLAAVYGVISRVGSLVIPLVSVHCVLVPETVPSCEGEAVDLTTPSSTSRE